MCAIYSWLGIFAVMSVLDTAYCELPEYIPVCSRNDPELDACALAAARASVAQFSRGDAARGWPPLDPMFVPELVVWIGPKDEGIKIVFKDNYFTGLSELSLTNMKFDLDKKIITAEGLVNLSVKAQYDMSGRILIIPIAGNGDASIKLKNTTMHIRYWYEHATAPDGRVHWNITRDELVYEVGRAIFRLENLLGADKRLGDQINKLLNDIWREIVADVGPTIAKALAGPVLANVKSFLDQVAFDDFMPE